MVRRILIPIALLVVSTAIGGLLAEWVYRSWFEPAADFGEQYYADAERVEMDPTTAEGLGRVAEYIEYVPDPVRPGRAKFIAGKTIHLCYRGMEDRPGLDDRGCVAFRINSWGIRDREELCGPKPEGQRRVVCVGDSTTVGWGVRIEDAWIRLAEKELRTQDDAIRLVNCGAAGAMYPDEYADRLRKHFHRFDPDVVLVTVCPNDLLPVNSGMLHFVRQPKPVPGWLAPSHLLRDLGGRLFQSGGLAADPDTDVVADLLSLTPDQFEGQGPKEVGAVFWSSGVPQAALLDIRDWCVANGARCAVAIWPFLQALDGSREGHPLAAMHDLVVAFCDEHGIPVLDLLDTFLGRDARALWISPKDQHGNPESHRLAAPCYAELLRGVLGGS